MRSASRLLLFGATILAGTSMARQGVPPVDAGAAPGQRSGETSDPATLAAENTPDPFIRSLVAQLDLERYKATIKALTRFGDRRQGTQRNRDAVDWIESQLKAYGYDTDRLTYSPLPPARGCGPSLSGPAAPARGAARGRGDFPNGQGGSRLYGNRVSVVVNCDPNLQPDVAVRELDSAPVLPGPVSEVYGTKVGATRPDEMYVVAAHMDGHGYNEAANDDGSGTALVMEVARILGASTVATERSVRFVLWNGEETGLEGSRAYVAQRRDLQGKEDPPGSRRFPEPTWLAVIQHDMMLWDHGMPHADGTMSKEQRPEADINIEFQSASKKAAESQALAWVFHSANQRYATDYPAEVGPHMTNTDSGPFQDLAAAISVRENERGRQIGAGWDPNWHQASDVFATYSDKDFRLGLNAAQTTLAAVAHIAGAHNK
jgi:hypothetical protein